MNGYGLSKTWTGGRVIALKRLWAERRSLKDIAAELGTSVDAVRNKVRTLRADGVPPRERETAAWDAARDAELTRLFAEGGSLEAIGAALGVSGQAVKGRLAKLRREGVDIPLRHGGPRKGARPQRAAVPSPPPPEESDRIVSRLAEIPDDTRGLTGRFFGDPLPGRSALDMERRAGR